MTTFSGGSRFKLYSIDGRALVEHLTTKMGDDRIRYEHSDWDVDSDGNITVYVEGKEPLKL